MRVKWKIAAGAGLTSLFFCIHLLDFSWQEVIGILNTPNQCNLDGMGGSVDVAVAQRRPFWKDVFLPVKLWCGHKLAARKGEKRRLHSGLFPEEENATLWEQDASLKKILIWHTTYGFSNSFNFGLGHKPFEAACCPQSRCVITTRRDRIPVEQFDAVLFQLSWLTSYTLPTRRLPAQRWVVVELEPPSHSHPFPTQFDSLFNWTMTYRTDADVYAGYGYVYPKALLGIKINSTSLPPNSTSPPLNFTSTSPNCTSPPPNFTSVPSNSTSSPFNSTPFHLNCVGKKRKMAAGMVSNCYSQSNRERLVKDLQKMIQVDIYGRCGSLRCPRTKSRDCYSLIERNYKFYLSFENSLWEDYVTEKFFNILKYNIVPVVYGLASYSSLAPPHSYIDASLFPDVSHLARYLIYLDRNDTAYQEYFRWKADYVVYTDMEWEVIAFKFCSLCFRLHSDSTNKVYDKFGQWFSGNDKCRPKRLT